VATDGFHQPFMRQMIEPAQLRSPARPRTRASGRAACAWSVVAGVEKQLPRVLQRLGEADAENLLVATVSPRRIKRTASRALRPCYVFFVKATWMITQRRSGRHQREGVPVREELPRLALGKGTGARLLGQFRRSRAFTGGSGAEQLARRQITPFTV
jgi:hypothetical protein